MQNEIINGFQISPQQKHLWLLQQATNNLPYQSSCAILLEGNLDKKTLNAALHNVVARHEILRTTFDCFLGMSIPLQVINDGDIPPVDNYDLSCLTPSEQEAKIELLFQEAKQLTFDFKLGPLLHISLATLSASKYVLFVSFPAMVADTVTLKNLVHEISQAYAALLYGEELFDEPMQYILVSEWQNQLLEAEEAEIGREYWRQQGISSNLTLKLPFENERSEEPEFHPQTLTYTISPDLLVKLKTLAEQYEVSASAFLLACWQIVLWRLTGQSDITVGTANDGRGDEELKGVLGLLTKYLPIYCHIEKSLKFSQVLEFVDQTQREAYNWQECFGWEQILGANAQPDYTPIFPFCFEFYELFSDCSNTDVSFSIYKYYTCFDRFKVKLSVLCKDNLDLSITLDYDSNLFSVEDIKRLAGQFCTILESVIKNPETALSELEILNNVERQQLLVEFNDTKTDFPQEKSLHQLFEEQVERTPDNIAVVFEDQQLTYSELNSRANQLAYYLQKLGIAPDILVGICVERSLDMVIGLLGVLKVGGAYLPLDPMYPKERLAFMLSDAQAPVLLTQSQLLKDLPETKACIICLDKFEAIAQESEKNPVNKVVADNLAYMIYTSGSTGKPKGVMVSHRAICNHMYWMQTTFLLTESDKILQKTPFSFDASVWEFYAPLLVGAQLLIARPGGHQDSNYLIKIIAEQKVTTVQLVPSLLRMLLEEKGIENCNSLKRIFCGGEALPVALQERLFAHLDVELYNLYGPTEACIDATFWACKRGYQQVVPIGRPIANTQTYILDSFGQPVPIGVFGELYIGGAGLARGYFNRPDLTAEKFIPNPFSNQPERLYKTGDKARYLSDGTIEYLGRIDHQVKLRGLRIELGEIEAVLAQHPQVLSTAVIVREDQPGNQRLVAYVVSDTQQLTVEQLLDFLQQKLPDYMVPKVFVFLPALPLTPNGKLDRRALPAPQPELNRVSNLIAPSTPTQKTIAAIWSEVLGLEEVGINDNFFNLGGHSLLATQVVLRMQTAFRQQIPVRRLFEFPTIAKLGELIETTGYSNLVSVAPELVPMSRDTNPPLSFAQARLWFLDQLEGETATYNMPISLRVVGKLDVAALEMALLEIIRRHEVLRTNFQIVKGEPVQVINPTPSTILSVVNLHGIPQVEQRELVQSHITTETQKPFDLSNSPLLRATLLQLANEEYVLLMTMHHIASDGWSMGIFTRELSSLYEAFSTRAPSPLPELPIQYADFAIWQRQWLSGCQLETQLNYWKQQLQDAPSLLSLPTDRPRPAIQTFRGCTERFELGTELTEKLKYLSQQSGTTMFMTMQAAFTTLLSRYSGQLDILVGSPIANRQYSELESLIGFFVNTLVFRTNLEGNPTFEELLAQVRQVALDAYAHQEPPFEQVVEALQPERNLSHNPLFQVMFDWQNGSMEELKLLGANLTLLEAESVTAKFDLTVSMEDTPQGTISWWEYNSDLFDAATIKRMAGHFQTLLDSIVANPKQHIQELPLITPAEQHQLSVVWNQTYTEYSQSLCIHQLFEAQVERTPNAVAVVYKDQQLTYQELNVRANQVARYLQKIFVRPEVLVGICVERSVEMVVGILGILKAGAAYVPLDPTYPQERLAMMLADAQISVLLTTENLKDKLIEHQGRIVCLDTQWELISAESENNPTAQVEPNNLAYVIYTSGSTGKPKGVTIAHSSLVSAYLSWKDGYQLLDNGSSHLQMAGFSFDVFTGDLVRALCSGAKLVLCPREWLLEPSKLYKLMLKEKVDCGEFVPAVLRNLIQYLNNNKLDLSFMKLLIVGSDSWYLNEYEEFQRLCGSQTRLINSYGVSEATIDSSYFERSTDESTEINLPNDGLVPIGRPIANTQIYILDSFGQPVPIGVFGELYIGGAGLARGYFNRPDLTAEKFIPNPFSNQPERLYKTGDKARYLSDGTIEYLGRLDHQVKLRGLRIELGEIEAVLAQHPQVLSTAVIVREDQPGNQRLVAYVVSDTQQLTVEQLLDFLQQKLPDYMVPKVFVFLPALPLTPNGKLDRRALPAPQPELNRVSNLIAPSTPTQKTIAAIWSEVLGLEEVSINDNFFNLGGHSLLATIVVSRMQTAFGQQIPMRRLFEFPTIAKLAELIGDSDLVSIVPELVPISRDTDKLPLSFAQTRLWFLNQLEKEAATYNMPIALRVVGKLDVTALEMALLEIIRRHEVLRTSFQIIKGEPVQVINSTPETILSVVNLQGMAGVEQPELVQSHMTTEAQKPFHLSNSPLLRATLLQLGNEEHVLLMTMHHIASDGWSMGIFTRELSSLYEAFSTRVPSPLPELPIQYADFAIWQRQWLSGSQLETQLNYWKQQLQGAPSVLSLPTDRPRPVMQTYRGSTECFEINLDLLQQLLKLSQDSGATLFMTLLAAFKILLSFYTGQLDIVVGSPIANRNHSQIESLIGFFVNTLVLRTNLEGNPTFKELLTKVRQVALDAYTHQDLPFEKLVESLQLERNLSHNPLFNVMFVLNNGVEERLEFPGLTISPLAMETVTVPFDLTLSITQTDLGLLGELEYNSDLFDADTIKRMAGHFLTLLRAIAAHPEQRLSHFSLLTEQERHQILIEWNNTQINYSQSRCIHQLFEEQVVRTPNALAVVFEDQQLTYQDLNDRANQLAHYLQAFGVRPEMLVGIYVERSLEMVIALLAVLKAGGAYVPLDPAYPKERLNLILSDTQILVLLTQKKLMAQLPHHKAHMVCLDGDWTETPTISKQNPVSSILPSNIAYVIYTSGSTGTPKGILIPHQGLVNHSSAIAREYGFTSKDRVLQFAGFSFDVAAEEMFPTWLSGATVVLRPTQMPISYTDFNQFVNKYSLTVLNLTAAYWHDWVLDMSQSKLALPRSLRLVVVGNEKVLLERLTAWQALAGTQISWRNAYGLTETTITATAYNPVNSPAKQNVASIPIGCPIGNVKIYILDRNLQPVPVNIPGEIYIGGAGLARGYLNRPDLTSERFIPNPFSQTPGERLYKTGDLARYLPDGNIEFLDRSDNQVKVRGFRIELGEIEAVLRQHPAVENAIVLTKDLIAYVTAKQEQRLIASELRSFLQKHLVEYMIPSAFVVLDKFPLTANGKIDRRALASEVRQYSLDKPHKSREAEFISPRDIMELQLAQIWSDVLSINHVGVRDNFFNLGGHSLLAVRLIAQIQQQFGKSLPLAVLFQSPTIEQMAHILRQQTDFQTSSPLVAIQPNGNQIPFFCIHPVGGNVLCYADLARHLGFEQPFYGLQSLGLNGEEPLTCIEDIAANYIEALQTIQPQGPYQIGGWSLGGVIAFEIAQQLQSRGHQVTLLALIDSLAPNTIKTSENTDEAMLVASFATDLGNLFGKELAVSVAELQQRSSEEQLSYIWQQAKMLEILPQEVGLQQIRSLLQVFKANSQAVYNYTLQPYPGKVTLFYADELVKETQDATQSWGAIAGSIESHKISGNHYTIIREPNIEILAKQLRTYLNQQGGK